MSPTHTSLDENSVAMQKRQMASGSVLLDGRYFVIQTMMALLTLGMGVINFSPQGWK